MTRILHFNVTQRPTSAWVVQQSREAFPFESTLRFLIFDLDGKYGIEVQVRTPLIHFNLANSDLACFRIGMSGSASFHSVRKSL